MTDPTNGAGGQGGHAPRATRMTDAELAAIAFAGEMRSPALSELPRLSLLAADALELDLSDPAGREFGDYRLLECIGEGGMGVVYSAYQASLQRTVAIKLLAAGPWASAAFVDRFKAEARHAARMQHPNIVAIHEVGSIDELDFFSMQLIRGRSLAERLRAEPRVHPKDAATLLRTIAEAVAYAHSLGVLHLDLKPANILLDERGVPHVADFGLARHADAALGGDDGEVAGTPAYMAPEQLSPAHGAVTPATDIWGLGAILYEVLTARPPRSTGSADRIVAAAAPGEVTPPRQLDRSVSRDLEAIVLRCLSTSPRQRYTSARALAEDLGRYLEDREVTARRLGHFERLRRWVRREPKFAGSLLMALVILAVGVGAVVHEWRLSVRSAERANAARNFLVGVFGQARPDENRDTPFTAEQLLEKGEHQLAAEDLHEPALRADLTTLLGTLYWEIGNYERADAILTRAATAASDRNVPADVRVRAMLALTLVKLDRNQFVDAIANGREALSLAQSGGLDAAREGAEARRLIGRALTGNGDAKDAEPLLLEALALDRALQGDIGDAEISDLTDLADARYEQGRFGEAITTSERALELARRTHGSEHSSVLVALEILARALKDQGDYARAERSLTEAVRVARSVYGEDHHETVVAKSNLLVALLAEGRYADALQGHLQLLDLERRKFSDSRPEQLAYAYGYLSADRFGLGQFTESETAARSALQYWARIGTSGDDWGSADAVGRLAIALHYQGRYAEAEREYRRQLAIQSGHEQRSSVWLNRTRGLLGEILRVQHRADQALVELDGALADMPPEDSKVRAMLLTLQSLALLDLGKPEMAERGASKALESMRQLVPVGNAELGSSLLALARARLAEQRPEAAEPLLREALAVRDRVFDMSDPRVLEIQAALAETLHALGRDDEAHTLASGTIAMIKASAPSMANALLPRLSTIRNIR